MVRACRLGVVGVVVLLVSSLETATAQVPVRQYGTDPFLDRPALSPYYQLMRRESSTGGTNYQLFVLPQLKAMEAAATQQRQIQQLQHQVSQTRTQGPAGPITTGHRTYFGNYSHFYGGTSTAAQSTLRRR